MKHCIVDYSSTHAKNLPKHFMLFSFPIYSGILDLLFCDCVILCRYATCYMPHILLRHIMIYAILQLHVHAQQFVYKKDMYKKLTTIIKYYVQYLKSNMVMNNIVYRRP